MRATLQKILTQLGQLHLLAEEETLSAAQLREFATQLKRYDLQLLERQRELLSSRDEERELSPYLADAENGNAADRRLGETLISQGKVGCLILAGGQGTRLGFEGPKGSFPISPLEGKSLFQIFSERIRAASLWAGHALPVCIMTSPLNHVQTVDFFHSHTFFGLAPSQVSFFEQGMLPLLDEKGHWFLEKPGKIAEGPDGNGHGLHLFCNTGVWELWTKKGVEFLNVIVVDNALADPFDPEFIGFTARTGVEVAVKAVARLFPEENMGVLVEKEGKLQVVEYTELPLKVSHFPLSHTGLFCFPMTSIPLLSASCLPLHLAQKTAFQRQVYKYERFLFDLLKHAQTSAALLYPRELTYAPLKNATGDRSVETVSQALLSYYRQIYHTATGALPSTHVFELDPSFYWPKDRL